MPSYRTLEEINTFYRITGFEFYGNEISAIVFGTRKYYLIRNKKRKTRGDFEYQRELNIFVGENWVISGDLEVPWEI